MSYDFTSVANHAEGTPAPLTAAPGWMTVWVKAATAAQFRHYLYLVNSADSTHQTGIITNPSAIDTKPGFYISAGNLANAQSQVSSAMTVGQWYCLLYSMVSTNSRIIQATGLPSLPKSGIFVPAGLNQVLLSGRPGDRAQNASTLMAHAAFGSARDMTDTEKAYILGGGNLRAISNLASYWKLNRQVSGKLPDEIGATDLSITGSLLAGADDPVVSTWFTGGALANLVFKVGTAVNLNLGAPFDNVNSAFTCAILQLGARVAASAAIGATSASGNEINLQSAAAFSAGDYIGIGTQSLPVLFVNQGSGIVLFDGPATWGDGDTVYRIPVSARPIAGTSITANVLTGPPTTPASYQNSFVRASNNANAALFHDSNLINIQVSSVATPSLIRKKRRRRLFVKIYSRR